MILVIVAPSRSAVTPAASNANSYGQQAKPELQAAAEEIQRLDALFSISSEEGDILPLNQHGAGTVSDDTAALLSQAMTISGQTGGLFDCSIAPVMQAWGLPREITVSRITETETITTGEPGAQNTIQVWGEGIAVIAAGCSALLYAC